MIKFTTNLGSFVIALDQEKAPVTSENFKQYVQNGYFVGTLFHRIIPGFMAQGGGILPGMINKTENQQDPIKNEASNGLKNDRGTIAMARTSDPHSATSQFFINVVDNGFLNFSSESVQGYGYCVFGKVVEGMETIDHFMTQETTSRRGHQDVPVNDIIIEKVEIVG